MSNTLSVEYSRKIIEDMLRRQEAVNNVMTGNGDKWRELERPWYRAMWTEAAEILLEWVDWEWWKKGEVSIQQAQLELVDIWHFALSAALETNDDAGEGYLDIPKIAESLGTAFFSWYGEACDIGTPVEYGPAEIEVICQDLEAFVVNVIEYKDVDLDNFTALMVHLGLTPQALYTWYIGKNRLNFFRQKHGDKKGTYTRQWDTTIDGVEGTYADNLVLEHCVKTVIGSNLSEDSDVSALLDEMLAKHYANHLEFEAE